ncbi:DUF1217 domain-containing protein [Roseomonas sp. E05]|uniref:DUF1217 domain-containing protein n=1 Tax=Roseomonas sp. E05 TaxID=3046310 RepID=UPI0024B94F45|nr:DUF1217 domain-containing protein [Roseomonas sp. E05]MDJ0390381.1 DUF1217 domain-containing protein [Roseomonas sp. E05]
MTVSLVGVGLPTGMAGWKLLQNKTPADFKAFSKDPILQRDIAYLREKLPSKLTSKDLLSDRRLQEMVLKAYGLDAQVGMNALMGKVLDSDATDTSSVAYRMTDSRYRQIASDFNYGGLSVAEIPAVPSTARVMVEGLRIGSGFTTFSGSFAGVTVKDLSLRDVQSYSQLAERLQAAFRAADGGNSGIRVVAAGPELVFTDAKARAQSPALNFTPVTGSKITAEVSGSTVTVNGPVAAGSAFASFSGSFAGVTVQDLALDGAANLAAMASKLQSAFRAADGNRSDISVTVDGSKLVFTDAKDRNNAVLSFTPASGSRVTATVTENTSGTPGTAAQGGPNVTKSDFVEQIVQRYTQARFEESLGDTSEALRKAIYAKRSLPQITSWYSIIADRNLAEVVQSTLGLPDSFGQLDVDRQKEILESRMSLSDFKDPAKLSKLLDRYVAQTSVAEAQALSSSAGIVSLVQPVSWGQDSFSGASSAALFSILSGI